MLRNFSLKAKKRNVVFKRTIRKTKTCRQLGGVCNEELHASTFEQMTNLSYGQGSHWELFEPQITISNQTDTISIKIFGNPIINTFTKIFNLSSLDIPLLIFKCYLVSNNFACNSCSEPNILYSYPGSDMFGNISGILANA